MGDQDEKDAGSRAPSKDRDVVVLAAPTSDGQGVHGVRLRHRRVELAEIRPVSRGQPLGGGELVSLRPRDNPAVCDVEPAPSVDPEELERRSTAGPARVSSDRYRRNYDRVFGKRRRRTRAS